MTAILLWLDANPDAELMLRLYFLAVTAFLAAIPIRWMGSAKAPRLDRITRWLFLISVFLTLLVCRWPAFFPFEWEDTDEAVTTAMAITALHHPVPWKDFDPLTSGPFDIYILTPPALLGLPLSLHSTRVIGMLLTYGAFVAIFFAIRMLYGELPARLSIMPLLVFFGFSQYRDYIHPTVELLSLFWWCLAVMFLVRAHVRGLRWGAIVGAGLAIGAMPFSKLQSAPLAVATLAVAIAVIALHGEVTFRRRVALVALICACAAIPGAILIGWAASAGVFHDFLISFILTGIAYRFMGGPPFSWFFTTEGWSAIFLPLLGAAVAASIAAIVWRPKPLSQKLVPLFALFLVFAGAYTAYSPHRGTWHYLLYLLYPMVAFTGCALGILLVRAATAGNRSVRLAVQIGLALIFLGVTMLPFLAASAYDYPYRGAFTQFIYRPEENEVTQMLKRFVRPGDRLAIWGWDAQYYVYTQTLLGTRDSQTQFAMYGAGNPYAGYYRQRFVADMERNKPLAFMDAKYDTSDPEEDVGQFSELKALLDREYVPVAEVPRGKMDERYGYRLYVRKP